MDLYTACVRCGSTPNIMLDMGKLGKVGLCTVCWVGLAGCMARDYSVFNNFNIDFHAEMEKALQRNVEISLRGAKKIHE